MTTATMYWITRCEGLNILGLFMAIMGLGAFAIMFLLSITDSLNIPKKFIKSFGIAGILGLIMCLFIPTTKQMAAIIVIPKIANSEKIQNLGNEVYDLAIDWMKEIKEGKQIAK